MRELLSQRKSYIQPFDIFSYILRHDETESIRIIATNVWKSNVENTPKTVKQILPNLLMKLDELILQEQDIHEMVTVCIKEFSSKYIEGSFKEIEQG